MMIITGGEPELCCRWHAKREGGVYAHMHYVCVILDKTSLVPRPHPLTRKGVW